MPDVYWLEQSVDDVPAGNDWLSRREILRQSTLRFDKRRAEWRLGRWTAKRAVTLSMALPDQPAALNVIEIQAAPDGAPEVVVAGKPAPAISLSHRAGVAICAIGPTGVVLGCDLELVEPRSDAFARDYFTPEEQAFLARACGVDRLRLLALFWSAKESALKALRAGLRADTRSVAVSLGQSAESSLSGWFPLDVHYSNQRTFHGWWRYSDGFLRTLVVDPPAAPVRLKIDG